MKSSGLNIAENGVTHEFELKHPVTGKVIGVNLMLIGLESDVPRAMLIRLADQMRVAEAKAQRTGKGNFSLSEMQQQCMIY